MAGCDQLDVRVTANDLRERLISSPRFRQPELATQSRPVVVIAGQGEDRRVQTLDQRTTLLVFLVGAGMGNVAGHKDCSRRIGEPRTSLGNV